MGRKSIPICYGMHLMELLVQAGVSLTCTREQEVVFSSVIDHHTLRRLGYKLQFHTWIHVGKGHVTATFEGGSEADTEDEGAHDTTAQAESTAPSQPSQPRPTSFQLASQIQNLATKTEIAHLRQFMVEQLHLLQATVMSKLESMDSRIQSCETHLLGQSRPTAPPPPPSSDPKGKAPMVSPRPTPSPTTSPALSPTFSPALTSHVPSPHTSPSAQRSPPHDPTAASSHSSSSSSRSDPQQFELAARTPITQSPTHSQDSEATPSDPARFIVTPPPSPPPPPPPPAPSPPPTPSDPSPAQPSPSPSPTPTTSYRRRKLAVSRPSSVTSPRPPPPY